MADQLSILPEPIRSRYEGAGLRERRFTYVWCNRVEVDFVCTRCLTISLDDVTCQHCMSAKEAAAKRLRAFLDSRQANPQEETP